LLILYRFETDSNPSPFSHKHMPPILVSLGTVVATMREHPLDTHMPSHSPVRQKMNQVFLGSRVCPRIEEIILHPVAVLPTRYRSPKPPGAIRCGGNHDQGFLGEAFAGLTRDN
jgi:hypothetical protein